MTKTKTLFVALALAAVPTLGFAQCSGYGHQEASMSCANGTVWDADTKTCVTVSG